MTTAKLVQAGLLPAPHVRVTSALLVNSTSATPSRVRVARMALYPEPVAPIRPRVRVSQLLLYPATTGLAPGLSLRVRWDGTRWVRISNVTWNGTAWV